MPRKYTWTVYILRCADGTLYTGITNNLEVRKNAHNAGTASKYTRVRRPVSLVYSEKSIDRSSASKREAEIKKYPRTEKERLISTGPPKKPRGNKKDPH